MSHPPPNFTTQSQSKFDSDKVGPDLALCLVFLSITPKIGPDSAGTMLYCSTVRHVVDLLYCNHTVRKSRSRSISQKSVCRGENSVPSKNTPLKKFAFAPLPIMAINLNYIMIFPFTSSHDVLTVGGYV